MIYNSRTRGFALRCFLGEWLRHAPREAPCQRTASPLSVLVARSSTDCQRTVRPLPSAARFEAALTGSMVARRGRERRIVDLPRFHGRLVVGVDGV